jgi:hypothetical protein
MSKAFLSQETQVSIKYQMPRTLLMTPSAIARRKLSAERKASLLAQEEFERRVANSKKFDHTHPHCQLVFAQEEGMKAQAQINYDITYALLDADRDNNYGAICVAKHKRARTGIDATTWGHIKTGYWWYKLGDDWYPPSDAEVADAFARKAEMDERRIYECVSCHKKITSSDRINQGFYENNDFHRRYREVSICTSCCTNVKTVDEMRAFCDFNRC